MTDTMQRRHETCDKPAFWGVPRSRMATWLTALLLLPWLAVTGRSQERDIFGTWVTDDGRGAVRIVPCGSSACGRITWLLVTQFKDGRPLTDVHNSDPAKRSRPICGLQVIGGLTRLTPGSWDDGWVYDPKVGKTYDVALTLQDAGVIEVRGYLKTKLLGQSHYWKRATSPLRPC
jgi:uncharacterized protein (DUF2147 family)